MVGAHPLHPRRHCLCGARHGRGECPGARHCHAPRGSDGDARHHGRGPALAGGGRPARGGQRRPLALHAVRARRGRLRQRVALCQLCGGAVEVHQWALPNAGLLWLRRGVHQGRARGLPARGGARELGRHGGHAHSDYKLGGGGRHARCGSERRRRWLLAGGLQRRHVRPARRLHGHAAHHLCRHWRRGKPAAVRPPPLCRHVLHHGAARLPRAHCRGRRHCAHLGRRQCAAAAAGRGLCRVAARRVHAAVHLWGLSLALAPAAAVRRRHGLAGRLYVHPQRGRVDSAGQGDALGRRAPGAGVGSVRRMRRGGVHCVGERRGDVGSAGLGGPL